MQATQRPDGRQQGSIKDWELKYQCNLAYLIGCMLLISRRQSLRPVGIGLQRPHTQGNMKSRSSPGVPPGASKGPRPSGLKIQGCPLQGIRCGLYERETLHFSLYSDVPLPNTLFSLGTLPRPSPKIALMSFSNSSIPLHLQQYSGVPLLF